MKTDLVATVGADGKLGGTLIVGVSSENLDSLGGTDTVDAIRGDVIGLSRGAKVTQSNYKDVDFIGVKATFTGLTLADFASLLEAKTEALASSGQIPADAVVLKFTKLADRYKIAGQIDLRDESDRDANLPGSDSGGLGGGSTPAVKLVIKFPGKVLKKDKFAVAKGSTLTWSGRPGRKVTIASEAALK